jgi:hypothetical protein
MSSRAPRVLQMRPPRHALGQTGVQLSAQTVVVHDREGDTEIPWCHVTAVQTTTTGTTVAPAIVCRDGRTVPLHALALSGLWTRWARRRADERLRVFAREFMRAPSDPALAAPQRETWVTPTAPLANRHRAAAGLALLVAIGGLPDGGGHTAARLSAGAVAILLAVLTLLHIHRRPAALEGARIAVLAVVCALVACVLAASG